jgi:hypothetical protein
MNGCLFLGMLVIMDTQACQESLTPDVHMAGASRLAGFDQYVGHLKLYLTHDIVSQPIACTAMMVCWKQLYLHCYLLDLGMTLLTSFNYNAACSGCTREHIKRQHLQHGSLHEQPKAANK